MELETAAQLFQQMGADKGLFIWALILAGREIRRLYGALLAEKDRLCDKNEQLKELYQHELTSLRRKYRELAGRKQT